ISRDSVPAVRGFDRIGRVLGRHFLPGPERPTDVVGLEVLSGRPIDGVVLLAGFADPDRRVESVAVRKILADAFQIVRAIPGVIMELVKEVVVKTGRKD